MSKSKEHVKDCEPSSAASKSCPAKKSKQECVFCMSAEKDELLLGEFITKEDISCHYFCLLLSSGLSQNGDPDDESCFRGFFVSDINSEVKRGSRLRCFYCQEKGATVGCCKKTCRKAFHLPCGKKNGCINQFFGGCGSYCDEHRPKQKEITADDDDAICCNICLIPLDGDLSSVDVLHSPCCNNSWFHRSCMQQYANSAGMHHMKCPLCNCTKQFLDEMLVQGIYVPDQDASWERQNGAFADLLERHNSCDADDCCCPSGRKHDAESGSFELLLCSCCGAYGSHRKCRGLSWCESSLMCPLCVSITKEFVEPERKALQLAAALNPSLSGPSSSGEKVVHLEMADGDEFVDVDGDIHVQSFLCKGFDIEQSKSCFVPLSRLDEVIPLSHGSLNIKRVPGFKYYRNKGYFVRRFKKGVKKDVAVKWKKRVVSTLSEDQNETNDSISEPVVEEKGTFLENTECNDFVGIKKRVECLEEKESTNTNTPSKLVVKHRSTSTAEKRYKSFLKNFSREDQIYHKVKPSKRKLDKIDFDSLKDTGIKKKLIQSTLSFLKSCEEQNQSNKSLENSIKDVSDVTKTPQKVNGKDESIVLSDSTNKRTSPSDFSKLKELRFLCRGFLE